MRTMSVRAGAVAIAASAAVLVAGTTSGGAAGQGERLGVFSGLPSVSSTTCTRALPLVGPWGLAGGGFVAAMPSAAARATSRAEPAPASSSRARTCRRRASTSPT